MVELARAQPNPDISRAFLFALSIANALGRELERPERLIRKAIPVASVLWFQGGACSGNTMSFLNADEANVIDLITDFGLDLLWHPSLGLELGDNARRLFEDPADVTVYLVEAADFTPGGPLTRAVRAGVKQVLGLIRDEPAFGSTSGADR